MSRLLNVVAIASVLFAFTAESLGEKLDLRNTPYGQSLRDQFISFRIGNNGRTDFEKLEYDTSTREVFGRLKVTAKHSWGEVKWTDYFSIPPVKNKKEIAVSATAKGEFIYNLETRRVAAGLRIPLGERSVTVFGKKYRWDFGELRLSADQVKRILEGDLLALVESTPNLGLYTKQHRNDYASTLQQLEQKYGAGNVYLASKQLVDKIKPSQGFNYAVSLIATGGASASEILQTLGNLALSETNKITEWLQQKGVAEANSIAASILEGRGVRLPNFYIALKWTTIQYRNRSLFANDVPITPWIKENHGAFYLVVQAKTSNSQQRIDSSGFDVGPLAGEDFPDRRIDGQITPDDRVPPFFEHAGIPASRPNARFEINVDNQTGKKIRVIILRGGHENPLHWSRTIPAGGTRRTIAGGVSERVLAVWERTAGSLVLMAPLVIDQDLKITIGRDPFNNEYWYGAIPQ